MWQYLLGKGLTFIRLFGFLSPESVLQSPKGLRENEDLGNGQPRLTSISTTGPKPAKKDVTEPGASGSRVSVTAEAGLPPAPGPLTLTRWGNRTVVPLQVGRGDGVEGVEGQAVRAVGRAGKAVFKVQQVLRFVVVRHVGGQVQVGGVLRREWKRPVWVAGGRGWAKTRASTDGRVPGLEPQVCGHSLSMPVFLWETNGLKVLNSETSCWKE